LLKVSEIVEQQSMHEDVSAAHLPKQQAVGCLVQELDVSPRSGLISDEQATKDKMLQGRLTTSP
jgi:hypothetical protein